MPCPRMQKRLIDRDCTEILQRQRLKSSNCTRETTARDLYLFKQQMRLPRSGRLELIGEQLCREGLGVLVGSKPNMSKWLREGLGLVQSGKGKAPEVLGRGRANSSLPMPTGTLSRR